ncbi:MAG: hypothetical protein ACKV19_16935 [Verrucomicrobiales bacterium]
MPVGRTRLWTWAVVGAVVGGGFVFAGSSALRLRRDLTPAHAYASQAAHQADPGGDDALAALAEHKRESSRELRSLLAAQQAIWQLFGAATGDEAARWVSGTNAASLPEAGLTTPLTALALRGKQRLPDDEGTLSQWSVTTTRFGEITVEVSDAGGEARVNWSKLASQLGTAPGPRTASTP